MTISHPRGLRRSARLISLFRSETTNPNSFYEFLARDTYEQLKAQEVEIAGLMLDIGGGAGYVSREFEARGVICVVLEPSAEELFLHGNSPSLRTLLGDGQLLPFADRSFDLVHCSNVLEHVPSPLDLLAEMRRILRDGGYGYLSYTPWHSMWGGHETSPWHLLGGESALERYRQQNGRDPKDVFGSSLFKIHVSEVQRWFKQNPDLRVVWCGPRYWPPSWRFLSRLPAIGEVLTWNHLIVYQKGSC